MQSTFDTFRVASSTISARITHGSARGSGAGATVRLPRTPVLLIGGRKFRENLDGKALTCAAVCEGLVDGDRTRRAFRIADREVERPVGEPLHADSFALLLIVSLRAGWYGVDVVVLAAQVNDDLVLDEDLISVWVERVAGLDRQLVAGGARTDAETADDPPTVKHAVMVMCLCTKVELLLRQVSSLRTWPLK